MTITNYEFKASVSDPDILESRLLVLNPVFAGEDHQIDTYFNITPGRLKLREGNIENALIYYERPDSESAKQSDVILYKHSPGTGLKEILSKIHGVKVVVDKIRRIYFIDNVKIHFDRVKSLGTFIEVEAKAEDQKTSIETLRRQCDSFITFFNIKQSDIIGKSYSDLLMGK
jgi:adenylate cyclase, class 2